MRIFDENYLLLENVGSFQSWNNIFGMLQYIENCSQTLLVAAGVGKLYYDVYKYYDIK